MELAYFDQNVALNRDNGTSWDKFNYIYLMGVMLCVLLLVLYTWRGLYFGKLQCDIREAEQTKAQLIQINKQLRLEKASLANLPEIDKLAKDELGLRPPLPEQIVIVEQEG